VLVVDDDAINLQVIEHILDAAGCRLAFARNGAEAIDLAERRQPNLIVMDVQMPVMDGFEATRRIRANPATAAIPVVTLTAMAMPVDRLRCLEAGATSYLSKPVDAELLRRTVATALAKRQSNPPNTAALVLSSQS
jgi:CheY-like chemotaxis protein